MKNILILFGTRPEAIKLAPVIHALKERRSDFNVRICVTGQHREMLDQVLRLFEIRPDHDLNIMSSNQDLFDVTSRTLIGLREVFQKERPDLILVQGDTTAAFASSLAALYSRVAIGHVEAGLRTYNKYHPFPEEMNRHMMTVMADYHFVPTVWAKENLLREGIAEPGIWITGNTGIDALLAVKEKLMDELKQKTWDEYFLKRHGLDFARIRKSERLILVTGHRRENFGAGFERICLALKEIVTRNKNVQIVYPVHLNPNVRKPVFDLLGSNKQIHLIEPLEYEPFVFLMMQSYFILTDSGGVQEEAPSLCKPVLVMRETTERPEGMEAGLVRLVGTSHEAISEEAQRLLDDSDHYRSMAAGANPYGDGRAARRIAQILSEVLSGVKV